MYRPPVRLQRSPGAPRPHGRLPSPAPSWGQPGARSPHAGSPRVRSPFSPGSPGFVACSGRGNAEWSPSGFVCGSRGFAGPMRRRGDGFRRPPNIQLRPSDVLVEKYFSPLMLEDPWKALQPVSAAEAAAVRRTT